MKIAYIFPPLGHAGARVQSIPLAPPVLEYLAGLTLHHRPDWDVRLINANGEDFSVDELNADLVGITVLTHQASWAYRTADALRARGVNVVLGGPHPSVLPLEARSHADTVVVGEAESVMEELLGDLTAGRLRDFYYGDFCSLGRLPFPKRDLLQSSIFHAFSTSRGCPYGCKFCTTPRLHGRLVRYRPIPEVVRDIANFRHRMWFCTDADIWGPDVARSIELFRTMAEEVGGIYWVGEGSIASVQHARGAEMLAWARKSGLMQVWVGWESFSSRVLQDYGAVSKMRADRETAVKKIRDSGIDVVLFIMLGSKDEDRREYDNVLKLTDELAITPHPVMVVPYPGTELYEELKHDLLHTDGWDFYDGMHSVIRQQGGPGENSSRDRALTRLWSELFTYPRIFKRMKKLSLNGFPSAHIASGMVQYALRKAFSQYGRLALFLPGCFGDTLSWLPDCSEEIESLPDSFADIWNCFQMYYSVIM